MRKSLYVNSVLGMVTVASLVAAAPPTASYAFGTVNGLLSQHAEHEMITRTLSRTAQDRGQLRPFDPFTLDLLAGKAHNFGAVGAPDDPADSNEGHGGKKHCDGADFLDIPSYPKSRADADEELKKCIDYFEQRLDAAVRFAGQLVEPNGQLNRRESTVRHCSFGTKSDPVQPAKCEVLNNFGRALHLVEDFPSHSNWIDAPVSQASTVNPPGLGRTDLPKFLRYPVPRDYTIPRNLATGCDDSGGGTITGVCAGRIGHSVLAKDSGWINPDTGGATVDPSYPRGAVGNNFQNAVTMARRLVRSVWGDFQEAITQKYGARRGDAVIDAIVRDAPWSECRTATGDAENFNRLFPGEDGKRSASVNIVNRTGQTLNCTRMNLDWGRWTIGPESPIAPGRVAALRTVSAGLATGTEGSVKYRIGSDGPADELSITWDVPYPIFQKNSYTCTVPSGFRCKQEGGKGNQAQVTFYIERK